MVRPKILIVDDERELADLVALYLQKDNLDVVVAYTGEEAYRHVLDTDFNLILLDIMLPGMSGIDLLRIVREERQNHCPVIMLTAVDSTSEKLECFSLGADDYIVKPFRPLEMVARVKAQLRRNTIYNKAQSADKNTSVQESSVITIGGLVIELSSRSVSVDEKAVHLTPIEYDILLALAKSQGSVVKVEELFEAVWHEPFIKGSNNTVMVHIRHLRDKLNDQAQKPRFIQNEWGVGYKLVDAKQS